MSISYKVLITASGKGERLGEITKHTNKALIKLGKKPTISYIIDAYPKNTPFVITLGHFGDQVRDFLQMAYPDHHFSFVQVDNYEGKGSSLGYSMLQASSHLQCPFIYHASDTIVEGRIPKPAKNWIAGYKDGSSANYTSFNVVNNNVQKILDKGAMDTNYLYIGLVGIYDFAKFWSSLKKLYLENSHGQELADIHAVNSLLDQGAHFQAEEFAKWYDTGNIDSLQKVRQEIHDSFHILDKFKESIFIYEKFVIKFYSDPAIVKQRVQRAAILDGLVPKIEQSSENFFKYPYAKGELYADVATPHNFESFLQWSKKHLWKKAEEVSPAAFKKVCHDFYFTKTQERIREFFQTRSTEDTENIINEEKVPTIKELLQQVDFDRLAMAEQSYFHGDFILDNIIKTKTGFTLLDWRHNFGGLLTAGDMYYDLAKLNHNLTVNHSIINKNLFDVDIADKKVTCDILRKENLVQCQKVLYKFLENENYDGKKVRLLTAIIWLNMSPLHHHPFDLFLFYFGKLNLWRAINEK